jgi:hypothetical protein
VVTLGLQSLTQGEIVLNDAILDDGDFAAAISVGMGVALIGRPVSGPARVPHGDVTIDRVLVKQPPEVNQFTSVAANADMSILNVGDARRVVTTIFKALKALKYYVCSLARANVTDNSTHDFFPPESLLAV